MSHRISQSSICGADIPKRKREKEKEEGAGRGSLVSSGPDIKAMRAGRKSRMTVQLSRFPPWHFPWLPHVVCSSPHATPNLRDDFIFSSSVKLEQIDPFQHFTREIYH